MSQNLKIGTYTSAKGGVYDCLSAEDATAIISKAIGKPLGKLGILPDGRVLCFAPKAPKSKSAAADSKASKGAASPGVSLTDLMAQIAALSALVGKGAAPAEAPAAKAPRKAKAA